MLPGESEPEQRSGAETPAAFTYDDLLYQAADYRDEFADWLSELGWKKSIDQMVGKFGGTALAFCLDGDNLHYASEEFDPSEIADERLREAFRNIVAFDPRENPVLNQEKLHRRRLVIWADHLDRHARLTARIEGNGDEPTDRKAG